MNFKYRKAVAADAKELAALAVKMWTSHTVGELTTDFVKVIENPDSAVFLLTDEIETIGFAQCGLRHDYAEGTKSSPVGYLEGIFVEEAYRKQGRAQKLLAHCEQWAKEKGCTEFASDCELDNEISRQFHLGLGFQEANRIICFTKKLQE